MNKKPTQSQTTPTEQGAVPAEKHPPVVSGGHSGHVPKQVAAPVSQGKQVRKWRQDEEDAATLSLSHGQGADAWVTLDASAESGEAYKVETDASGEVWAASHHALYQQPETSEGLWPTGQAPVSPVEEGGLVRVAAAESGAGEGGSITLQFEEPVAALPKALPPVLHGSEGNAAELAGMGDWFLPALALGGGLALGGLGGGGGGGGTAGGAAGSNGINIGGLFVGGPVMAGHGLHVQMLDAAGNVLADQALTADGQFNLSGITYTGVFTLRVYDTNAANDQYDEAIGASNLGATEFHAVGVLTAADLGQTLYYNVNYFTEAAYQQVASQSGGMDAAHINQANQAISQAMGGLSLLGGAITTINTAVDGDANNFGDDNASFDPTTAAGRYGLLLAAVAGADFLNGAADIGPVIANGMLGGSLSTTLLQALTDGIQYVYDHSYGLSVDLPAAWGQFIAGLGAAGPQTDTWWIKADSSQVDEGGTMSFVVTRVGPLSAGTIDWQIMGGSATAADLWFGSATSGTLSFAAGESSQRITLQTFQDFSVEAIETMTVGISNPSGVGDKITTSTATTSIVDHDQSFWAISAPATVSEGDANGYVEFTITRGGNIDSDDIISFSTAGGTARGGVSGDSLRDYTPVANQVVTFAAGETSKTVRVNLYNDSTPEANETIVGSIGNAGSGTITSGTATVTVLDDDQSVWAITAGAPTVAEGAGYITYVVTRTGDVSGAASIEFMTAGGTASAGQDYTGLSQTLSFAAGETSKTVRVSVLDDSLLESNETLVGSISNTTSGTIGTSSATVTIIDNDQINWTVSTDPAGVSESAGFITYVVRRTGDVSGTASIDFVTGGGTASAGSDYTALSQTLTFAAGETSKTVQVAINDDGTKETNETVVGSISGASAGNVITGSATATILDDDQSVWSIAAATPTVDEGAGYVTYVISRTGNVAAQAQITFRTSGGTASEGDDYGAAFQTYTFAAGETSKTIQVQLLDDSVAEGNETLQASISLPSQGDIDVGTAVVTILDNEQASWTISAEPLQVDEGAGYITYVVRRTGRTDSNVTMDFTTGGGSATAGADYTPFIQTLSFAAGDVERVVRVALNDDSSAENNETLTATISNLQMVTGPGPISFSDPHDLISVGSATATILDNDQSIWSISTDPAGVDEKAGYLTYVVRRTGDTSAATLHFSTAGGTATGSGANTDYTAITDQVLSFANGQTSQIVRVAITDDTRKEGDETVIGSISGASAGNIAVATATATILDDDQSVWSISLDTASVLEGDFGSRYVTYTISRTGDLSSAATINYGEVGGTATAGVDYLPSIGLYTLSFRAGQSTQTVTFGVFGDTSVEGDETVVFGISSPSTGNIAVATATLTILDDDAQAWSISTDQAGANEAAGYITYVVSRTGRTDFEASIVFSTGGGTAQGGPDSDGTRDYTTLSQTLSFAAGETSRLVQVAIRDDQSTEGNETVVGSISNASSGRITTNSATATIIDDEQAVWSISTDPAGVDEGAGYITYVVHRTGDTRAATIHFSTVGGSATAGADYTAEDRVLTFAAGQDTQTVLVAINNDTTKEGNETVQGGISGASTGSIGVSTATATILDNDQPIWSISTDTPTVSEGANSIVYVVRRSGDCSAQGVIHFSTSGGTATAGSDYVAVSDQALTFAAGETEKTVMVDINRFDSAPESDETVVGSIFSASAGDIAVATATATIVDDDQSVWSIRADTPSVGEGGGYLVYVISRTGDVSLASTIDFMTAGGTASAGADYTAQSLNLSFAAGETSKTIRVAINDDSLPEINETVVGSIANAQRGSIATSAATATIVDNEQSNWTLTADSASVGEASGYLSYTISRTGALGAAVIDFSTGGGTAKGGTDSDTTRDYTALSQSLSFAAGEWTKTIRVALYDDAVREASETVMATISNVRSGSTTGSGSTDGTGGTDGLDGSVNTDLISTGSATTTIVDDDQPIWSIKADPASSDEGSGYLSFVISRSGDISRSGTIYYKTAGGTAKGGASSDSTRDYTYESDMLILAAGESSRVIRVALNDDTQAESNETVVVSLYGATDGAIETPTATATIIDNDQSVWSVNTATAQVSEGAGYITYVVSRSGKSTGSATLDFVTLGSGTATAGSDYTAKSQTLSFAAGETSKTILVAITDDSISEGNETVVASIANANSGSLGNTTATATILDDDQPNWSLGTATTTVSEGAGYITYVISRTGKLDDAVTVDFAITGGTAVGGAGTDATRDYTAQALQHISFAAGVASQSIQVAINDDATAESNETVIASISNATRGNLVSTATQSTVTILDNDQSIWSVSAATDKVDEGAGYISYVVSRQDASVAGSIDFYTMGGTAKGGLGSDSTRDYTRVSQTLSFAVGELSKTVLVAVYDDALNEGVDTNAIAGVAGETVVAGIANATTGTIVTNSATALILDNENALWSVSALSSSVTEGGLAGFVVTRSGNLSSSATVDFVSGGGTNSNSSLGASATGGGVDYTDVPKTQLSFAAGVSSQVVYVQLTPDTVGEAAEYLYAGISNASVGAIFTPNAYYASCESTAPVKIVDDDQPMFWSVSAASAREGGYLVYTISRTGDTSLSASIDFATLASGTNANASDFESVSSHTLNFAAGVASQTILVKTLTDGVAEGDEQVTGVIGNASQGVVSTSSASASVIDADVSKAVFSVAPSSSMYIEAAQDAMLFTITRSGDLSKAVTLDYAPGTGTSMTQGSDYTGGSGTVTFAPGVSKITVSIPLLDDLVSESSEYINLVLRNLSAGDYNSSAYGISAGIYDNDKTAGLSYQATGMPVTNESTGWLMFSLTRYVNYDNGIASLAAETMYFRTNGGTATGGTDFSSSSTDYINPGTLTLNWAAGETYKSILIRVNNDGVTDGATSYETITGQWSKSATFSSTLTTTTAYIMDAQAAVAATSYTLPASSSCYEGGAVQVTVTRSGDVSSTATTYLRVNPTGTTASVGTDYIDPGTLTLSWAVGETSKSILISLPDDGNSEVRHSIAMQMATDSGFTSGVVSQTYSIYDNDWSVATAGQNDTVTMGTAGSGATAWYQGGFMVDTGDGNDTVTDTSNQRAQLSLGAGDDLLILNSSVGFGITTGAMVDAGTGVDTVRFTSTGDSRDLVAGWATNPGPLAKGFETIHLAGNNQILKLNLQDVLDITTGNAVADTLRIMATGTGDNVNLVALGKTLSTPTAGTTIKDVDGTDLTVAASAAGNANCNDVTINGTVYDVYQYVHDGHNINLLISTTATTTVI